MSPEQQLREAHRRAPNRHVDVLEAALWSAVGRLLEPIPEWVLDAVSGETEDAILGVEAYQAWLIGGVKP